MFITVFGGASPNPGETPYNDAYQLGYALALAGHTVLTGGYNGTMAGVSQGASEAGGHVIGVTCEEIRQLRGSRANPYVQEEWLCPTLDIRLKKLMETSHAAIALPGGPGTLTEISLMWNRMIIKTLPIKPLILVGSGWKATFSALFKELSGYINPEDMRLLSYTPDVQGAVDKLNKLFEPGK